jgi:hypothetical protein
VSAKKVHMYVYPVPAVRVGLTVHVAIPSLQNMYNSSHARNKFTTR